MLKRGFSIYSKSFFVKMDLRKEIRRKTYIWTLCFFAILPLLHIMRELPLFDLGDSEAVGRGQGEMNPANIRSTLQFLLDYE